MDVLRCRCRRGEGLASGTVEGTVDVNKGRVLEREDAREGRDPPVVDALPSPVEVLTRLAGTGDDELCWELVATMEGGCRQRGDGERDCYRWVVWTEGHA